MTRLEKFDEFMRRIGNVHYADNYSMDLAYQKIENRLEDEKDIL